jgi:hypothetical protein
MTAMKKLLFILGFISILAFSSCSASKEARSANAEARHEQELVNQALVKQAVESRRFIVRLERIYLYGGMVDLVPRLNYIIVDGEKAVINTAYIGRQWDIRPIAGINVRGVTSEYELTNKVSKGLYQVNMKVGNGAALFNVYLTIGQDGNVSASLNSLRIDNARYRGHVIPISNRNPENLRNQEQEEVREII